MTEHRAIATSRATYQDMLDAPEHMIAEILNGRLYLQPRLRSRHALACSALGSEIGGPFHFRPDGPGGWWILYEPEIHLGEDVRPQCMVPNIRADIHECGSLNIVPFDYGEFFCLI